MKKFIKRNFYTLTGIVEWSLRIIGVACALTALGLTFPACAATHTNTEFWITALYHVAIAIGICYVYTKLANFVYCLNYEDVEKIFFSDND